MIIFATRLAAFVSIVAAAPAAAACNPQRESVTLRLADFDSPAEIATPSAGTRARGLVVLFQGSDIADKDGAIVGAGDAIVSRPMRQVAERLACSGYVTLRYNKRYVTGATTADAAKFAGLTGTDLAADGRTALAFARGRAELAKLPIALVGWSEGSTVAMAVAAAEPSVRAIVLLAPVIASSAATVQGHYERIGRPYLQRYAKAAVLDADAIAAADAGPGGVLAHIFVRMFRGFRPGERINPLLDTDKDGRIAFAEADPVIALWYADVPDGGLGMAATGRALKGVGDAFAASTPPVLIVQGLNDAMVDPAAAQAFAAREEARGRVTLRTYPGLGHALGPAQSAIEDGLLPTADAPMSDVTRWLDRTLSRGTRGAR